MKLINTSVLIPIIHFVIILLSIVASLTSLSVHEALASNRTAGSIINSKLRVILKSLAENSRLNFIIHIQAIAGLVLTVHLLGETNKNLELLMVGLLLISTFTYQLLKDAENLNPATLLHKVLDISIVIVLLSLAHLYSGTIQLLIALIIYIFLESLSFTSTAIHPWHKNQETYLIEVFSTEIIKYWLIASIVIAHFGSDSVALGLLVAGVGYYLLSLLAKPVVRGSIAKRTTFKSLVHKVLLSSASIVIYLVMILWGKS